MPSSPTAEWFCCLALTLRLYGLNMRDGRKKESLNAIPWSWMTHDPSQGFLFFQFLFLAKRRIPSINSIPASLRRHPRVPSRGDHELSVVSVGSASVDEVLKVVPGISIVVFGAEPLPRYIKRQCMTSRSSRGTKLARLAPSCRAPEIHHHHCSTEFTCKEKNE